MLRKITDNIVESDIDRFLSHYVRVYELLFMQSNIADSEIRYLVEFIKLHRQGISIDSSRAVRKVALVFKSKPGSVRAARSKIKGKGWFIQTIDGLELHPALKSNFEKVQFNVTLDYEPITEDRSSSPGEQAQVPISSS